MITQLHRLVTMLIEAGGYSANLK